MVLAHPPRTHPGASASITGVENPHIKNISFKTLELYGEIIKLFFNSAIHNDFKIAFDGEVFIVLHKC